MYLPKNKPLQHLLQRILLYMCQTNMATNLHIYVIHLMGIYGGCMWKYMLHRKSLVSTMWPGTLHIYFASYISCYSHIPPNQYGYHSAHIDHTALILYGLLDPILVHLSTETLPTAASTSHDTGIYMSETHMAENCTYMPYMQNIWCSCTVEAVLGNPLVDNAKWSQMKGWFPKRLFHCVPHSFWARIGDWRWGDGHPKRVSLYGECMPINVLHMKSLASTLSPGMLHTSDDDGDITNDANKVGRNASKVYRWGWPVIRVNYQPIKIWKWA